MIDAMIVLICGVLGGLGNSLYAAKMDNTIDEGDFKNYAINVAIGALVGVAAILTILVPAGVVIAAFTALGCGYSGIDGLEILLKVSKKITG